jgi:hypothetical protein
MVLLLAVLATPAALEAAGDTVLERATMRGLTAVGVVIDTLDPELVRQGLTPETLQSRIEARLQNASIPLDKSAREFVGLRVMYVRRNKGPYALCLALGLYQPVMLSRDQKTRTATQTWEVETVLLVEPKLLSQASVTAVDALVERFVVAYRYVNPR